MRAAFEERRRSPRAVVAGYTLVADVSWPVQVMDISAGGVLLASTVPVAVGRRGWLLTSLGADPLKAEIEVRRVARLAAGPYGLGARFVSLHTPGRATLLAFLERQAQASSIRKGER